CESVSPAQDRRRPGYATRPRPAALSGSSPAEGSGPCRDPPGAWACARGKEARIAPPCLPPARCSTAPSARPSHRPARAVVASVEQPVTQDGDDRLDPVPPCDLLPFLVFP